MDIHARVVSERSQRGSTKRGEHLVLYGMLIDSEADLVGRIAGLRWSRGINSFRLIGNGTRHQKSQADAHKQFGIVRDIDLEEEEYRTRMTFGEMRKGRALRTSTHAGPTSLRWHLTTLIAQI